MQLQLDGYDVVETLGESTRAVLVRARRRSDGVPVIVKLLAAEHPTPEDVGRLRHEHDIVGRLDLPGIVRPLGIERFGHRVGLVLEDFGGTALEAMIGPEGMDTESFLHIAVSLADALGQLHAAGVVHKDVKPANVLVDLAAGVVKLADFGLAARLGAGDGQAPVTLQGTLAYLSPEQTGRTERIPDHRSDLYSLGATFYEMLTGRVPFPAEDPMEVIHCHLAVRPVPPATANPKIPVVVSDIVAKLLGKEPEHRYQSAYGVRRDLERCREAWRARGTVEPFPLAGYDRAGRFSLPDRLYGREGEARLLLTAFERVSLGGAALVLLSGASGVGKSALVHEVRPAVSDRGGWLVEGKFDQYAQGGPYASLIAALRQLARQLLGEPAEQLAAWKRTILEALGANSGLVVDVVPEMALVIGEVPAPPEVGPTEAQNRFNLVFSRFLGLFARPDHPLVLFLDDLHWADLDSLRLLSSLVADPDAAHLLVIGAYRPESVSGSHPLALTLAEIDPALVERLDLAPLPAATANQYVADALSVTPDEAAPLAALLHGRTDGNPFFLGELLRSLHHDGLLAFSAGDGRWTWDLDDIRRRGVTDDVVELMAAKVAQLAPEAQQALRTAAVVGNRFNLDTLALALGRTEEATAVALAEGLEHELVLRSDDKEYRFLHDRVQQACHSTIPADEVTTLHLSVGRLLLYRLRQRGGDDDLFTIAAHLNAAASLLTDPASRLELAELNLAAARKARASTAHDSTATHVAHGLTLLPEDPWATAYQLTFDLHLFQAQVRAVLGQVDQSEGLFEVVLHQARSDDDKAVCCDARSEVLHSAGRPAEAYAVARMGLQMLGVHFPEGADEAAEQVATLMQQLLDPSVVTRLESLEPGDERALLTGRLFWRAVIGAYYSQPGDLPLVVCRNLDHLLRTGMTPEASLALALLGFIAVMQGQLEPGVAYAEAAVGLAQRFGDPFVRGRTEAVAWVLCLCWKQPFELSEGALHETFLTCHGVGDLEFGNHTMIGAYISALMAGRDWQAILDRNQRWLDYCERFVPLEAGQARIRVDGARRLMALDREPLDVEGVIARYAEEGDVTDVCESLNELACTETLFGEYQAAYDHAVRAESDVDAGAAGTLLFNLLFRVYYAVAAARLGHLDKVDELLTRIRPYAELTPDNFASYLSLAEAERARAQGDTDAAVLGYLRTIGHAGAHRYLTLEGFAHELLARLLAEQGHRSAAAHFREAHGVYLECGARGKAQQLEAEIAGLAAAGRSTGRQSSSVSTDPGTERSSALDLDSVLKASEAIAGEVAPDRVVARLIGISIENAGAERAVFVSVDGDDLRVEAEGRAGQPEVIEHGSVPVETGDIVLPRAVRYVARTGDAMVIGDPAHVPKSLLVLPIARQHKVTGILYLENDLVAGAFTPARLELLRVLSAQMAISLENARLYAQLEEKVRDRTAELSETLDNLRAAQRQIVESEKLAALGGLVAGVAHEINTPVGIAVTAASHLAERTTELRSAVESGALKRSALDSFLDTVEESGRLVVSNLGRAAELVRSFKQVAVDQSSEARRSFGVRRYLEDILQSLRPKLKRSPHLIEIECDAELMVTSYPGAVAQVVTNLVMNSLVHAYDEGEQGTLRFEVRPRGTGVRLLYSDDGRGVAPDVLERMFDPFFTTRRGQGGSGLGLHIVHNLVTQRLAGTVSVKSTPGQGTTFTIDIPSHA
jgi:predicted ATPase/signal transduction histidine kinase